MASRVTPNTGAVLRFAKKYRDDKLKAFAQEMTRNAKRPASLGGAPYLTGTLRRSIQWAKVAPGVYIVYTSCGYGGFIEMGTSKRQANPFFKRAFEKAKADSKG